MYATAGLSPSAREKTLAQTTRKRLLETDRSSLSKGVEQNESSALRLHSDTPCFREGVAARTTERQVLQGIELVLHPPNSDAAEEVSSSKNQICHDNPRGLYLPVRSDLNEIRLLRLLPSRNPANQLEGTLEVVSLLESPIYAALSYEWGIVMTDSDSNFTLKVNNHNLCLRPNLAQALICVRERLHKPLCIWIDFICINQDDVDERGRQVELMKAIYDKAYGVWVWLGPEADQSELAMDVIGELQLFPEDMRGCLSRPVKWAAQLLSDPACETRRQALCNFFRRSYWRRLWIVQEVVIGSCGKMPMLCCGRRWTVLGHIFKLVRGIRYLEHQLSRRTIGFEAMWAALEPAKHLQEAAAIVLSLADHVEEYSANTLDECRLDLLQSLYRYNSSLCSDPRDKVYGLLGITGHQFSGLKVDYTLPMSEVYWRTTALIIQSSNRLDLLSRCALKDAHARPKTACDIPSWVPDWSQDLEGSGLALRFRSRIGFRSHRSVGDVVINGRVLHVHAIFLGKVIGGCPIRPSCSSLSEEHHLMKLLDLMRRVHGDDPEELDAIGLNSTSWSFDTFFQGNSLDRHSYGPSTIRYPEDLGELTSIQSLYDILFCSNKSEGADPPTVLRTAFTSWCVSQLRKEYTKPLGFASSIGAAVIQPQRKLFVCHQDGVESLFGSWWRSFGSCLAEVCEGDRVALIQGCDYPILVRQANGGGIAEYKVVGECFHSGIEVSDLFIEEIELG